MKILRKFAIQKKKRKIQKKNKKKVKKQMVVSLCICVKCEIPPFALQPGYTSSLYLPIKVPGNPNKLSSILTLNVV